jgi:transcriptional regulator with XRE-family HTH domain
MNRRDDVLALRVGSRINAARRDAGLTQAELAEEVGIDARSLQRIEGGRTTPSLRRLLAIADVLRVSPGALLDDVPAPRKRARNTTTARDAPRTADEPNASLLRVWARIAPSRRRIALKILRILASEPIDEE